MTPKDRARAAASDWIEALMQLSKEDRRAEILQLLFDAMDATEQSGIDAQLVRARDAFEGKPTGAQGRFRDVAQADRDRLRLAVGTFLRHKATPEEKLEVFNESAVKALQAALTRSYESDPD